ncbi:MAG: MBL fold metallo-hydrolase [Firmicutes bacterium]|nr:MBL fold metallo-hydrolase [Bacillota bacterium]
MLKLQSIASGSKGNVTYIASDTTQIFCDVGLSLPTLLKRLLTTTIDPNMVDGIVITHEHSDHINGLKKFMAKFPRATLFLHADAVSIMENVIGAIDINRLHTFSESFAIGDIEIDFFPLPHDSRFCFGYTFRNADCRVGVATDLGTLPPTAIQKLAGCQVVLLESNHDMVKLQHNVKYPNWLKRRITGPTGHLSNTACGAAVYRLLREGVQQVILAHLSQENNCPNIAMATVREFLTSKGVCCQNDIQIDVAHQDRVGDVYHVN